jgi:hypothetical protein
MENRALRGKFEAKKEGIGYLREMRSEGYSNLYS